MQHSRSSEVILRIRGQGSVEFKDIAMVWNLWFRRGSSVARVHGERWYMTV